MIKKKLNILLLLLLALLFINLLGTTCLAYSYTFTSDDCDTIIERFAQSSYQSWFKARLWGRVNTLQQQYDIVAIDFDRYSYKDYFFIYGFNTSQVTNVSNAGNRNYMGVTLSSPGYKYQVSYENSGTNTGSSWNGGQFGTGAQLRTQYLVINNDIGSFYSGPWQSSEVITFEEPTNFTYAKSELNGLINLNGSYAFGNTAEEILFVYNPFSGDEINEADSVITGYLWDADIFDYAIFTTYKYDYATKQFKYSGDTWTTRNIGQIHDNMYWVEFKASDYGTRLIPDSLLHAEFIPNTNEFNHIHVDFYVRSPHTDIVDGVLQVDGTFSGDYALIVNSNNNTDKIINNENEKDDFWKNTYNNLFTLDSGDVTELNNQLNDMIDTEELSGINEELDLFDNLTNMTPTDLILEWNDITWGNYKIINASQINFSQLVRQYPAFQEVMRVTRILIIGALAWLGVKEVWRSICITLGIGFELYENHEAEDEIVTSQHETWNYNTGQATISTTRRQGRNSVTVVGKAPLRKRIG